MSKVMRTLKNVTKGYSTVQVKGREGESTRAVLWSPVVLEVIYANSASPPATSNDAWGTTGTQMSEIAQMTYNSYVTIIEFTGGKCH